MSECIKCGRETERPPLSFDTLREVDPLEEDHNGIVWLCDEHIEELLGWFGNEETEYEYVSKDSPKDETVVIPDEAVGVTTDYFSDNMSIRYLVPVDVCED